MFPRTRGSVDTGPGTRARLDWVPHLTFHERKNE
ncbi:hypothetical protein CaCOL14_010723 [Colletotrichum acutatum]